MEKIIILYIILYRGCDTFFTIFDILERMREREKRRDFHDIPSNISRYVAYVGSDGPDRSGMQARSLLRRASQARAMMT